jgi:hypothetical protein
VSEGSNWGVKWAVDTGRSWVAPRALVSTSEAVHLNRHDG